MYLTVDTSYERTRDYAALEVQDEAGMIEALIRLIRKKHTHSGLSQVENALYSTIHDGVISLGLFSVIRRLARKFAVAEIGDPSETVPETLTGELPSVSRERRIALFKSLWSDITGGFGDHAYDRLVRRRHERIARWKASRDQDQPHPQRGVQYAVED